jgi:hypothetical protein
VLGSVGDLPGHHPNSTGHDFPSQARHSQYSSTRDDLGLQKEGAGHMQTLSHLSTSRSGCPGGILKPTPRDTRLFA